ncbi:MAG: ABC transporter permease [Lachnospiraceae bacterium]|nr:ABC transporter permease [Lachnospiraceae bacterium]
MDADYFLLSDSAEDLISVSNLNTDVYEQLVAQTDAELAVLDIQRMYLSRQGDAEKLNITYFAIEAGSFLEPAVTEGVQFANSTVENPILLDDDFALEGIEIGDTVLDSSTELEFTVIGFVEDQMYGHTSIGFITTDTYTKLRTLLNPMYEKEYHAIAVRGGNVENINLDGTELVAKAEIIENVPSYTAEHMTITMIVWVLVVVSATIIGVFYYILTLQKRKQFGIMKAIGLGMGRLAGIAASQVCIIAACGAVIANLLTFAMAAALPETMPFYLKSGSACLVTVVFILISIVSSLISILNISHVDPMKVIGGADE